MLNKVEELNGYKLNSLDGEIGTIKDIYFDDKYWAVRYLVVDTGNWLMERKVLISPHALGVLNKKEQRIAINLTKKQIENSPHLDSDKPVSQQFQNAYYEYYQLPEYWIGSTMWGGEPVFERNIAKVKGNVSSGKPWDPNLRSAKSVVGHNIVATDGEIGMVDDFVLDDEAWAIRYIIVETRDWWKENKLLISPKWIERISWDESKVFVTVTREIIKQSPQYKGVSPISREYEEKLHQHYNKTVYWTSEPIVNLHS